MNLKELIKFSSDHREDLIKSLNNAKSNSITAIRNLPLHEKNALCFLAMRSPADLCRLLKSNFESVEYHINNPDYSHFSIPKKRGGKRNISAPFEDLKKVQKSLNYFLQAYYLCIKPSHVFGFVIHPHYLKGASNIVENARLHVGKRYLLNIDLLNFFPSISAARVKSVFMSDKFCFDEPMCIALTLLTTYLGELPTGSPTSPVISNLVCLRMDDELENFAKANDLVYSRYADDLSFSSVKPIYNVTVLDIYSIIQRNHFKVNDKKIRMRHSGQRMVVTGITVNEKVNVKRSFIKRVRAMIFDIKVSGIENAAKKHFNKELDTEGKLIKKYINRIEGYLNFIGQVRGRNERVYMRLNADFQKEFQPNYKNSL
jgi:RNA-directed DNA polymerase